MRWNLFHQGLIICAVQQKRHSKVHLMHRHMKVGEICFSVPIPRWLFGCVCQSEGGNKKAEKSVAAMGVECIFPLSGYKKSSVQRFGEVLGVLNLIL